MEQGAATSVWCATNPRLDGLGGVYCEDCDIAIVNEGGGGRKGVSSWACDPEAAERLWQLSAEWTGFHRFKFGNFRKRRQLGLLTFHGRGWLLLCLCWCDLTGWLWTGLIERISLDRGSRTCDEDRRRARSRSC